MIRLSLIWACLIMAAVGCGGKSGAATAHLSGAVTVNGKPLPEDAEGYMQFMPMEAGQAPPTSTEIRGGKYDAPDAPKGKVNVVFNITRLTGRMVREDNVPTATPYPERQDLVPKKHRAGMPIEISEDNNAFDFNL